MNILMLMPESEPIIDRRVLQQARSLHGAGHRVTVLAGFRCPEESHFTVDDIEVHRYAFGRNNKLVSGAKVVLPPNRPIGRYARALYGYLKDSFSSAYDDFVLQTARKFPFDAVHVHDLPLLKHGAILSGENKCLLVYDAHELYYALTVLPPYMRKRLKAEEIRYVPQVDLFFTASPGIADYFEALHGRRPLVLMNCSDKPAQCDRATGRAELRRLTGLDSAARIVIFQGWISAERNLDTLVRAADCFPDESALVIIGYGPYEEELRNIATSIRMPDKVKFLGRIENKALPPLTAGADIGVITYLPVDLNSTCSAPNKFFEFVVAGVPVLAHDLPFMRAMSERYGVVEVGDLSSPASAARWVTQMLEDSSCLATMRENCEAAAKELNWKVESRKLLEAYRRVS